MKHMKSWKIVPPNSQFKKPSLTYVLASTASLYLCVVLCHWISHVPSHWHVFSIYRVSDQILTQEFLTKQIFQMYN